MMKRTLILFAVLLSLVAGASAAQRPASKAPAKEPPPDYFPLPGGAWWKYKSTTDAGATSEFTMKVAGEEKLGDVTAILVDIESAWPIREWYSKGGGVVSWHKEAYLKNNQSAVFSPTRIAMKNPLASGQTWSWKGKGVMDVAIDETATVSGVEDVVTAAGTFKAVKVSTTVIQGGATVQKTYWYANWIGLVKAITDTGTIRSTTELVDWSFRKR